MYVVWIGFELVIVYFFFKETQGMSLESTAAIFDGQEAVRAIAVKGETALEAQGVATPVYESKEQVEEPKVNVVDRA